LSVLALFLFEAEPDRHIGAELRTAKQKGGDDGGGQQDKQGRIH
jgi:hypothetical protein